MQKPLLDKQRLYISCMITPGSRRQGCNIGCDEFMLYLCVQEMAAPVRQYKLTSLRQIFRSRSNLPGTLHKTFMRAAESDADETAV